MATPIETYLASLGTGTPDSDDLFPAIVDGVVKNVTGSHVLGLGDASAASAVSYAGGTGMSATNVEAAIDELATEKANATDLTAHIADTTDAHDASAISYAGGTGMSATDVEAALDELASEVEASAAILADGSLGAAPQAVGRVGALRLPPLVDTPTITVNKGISATAISGGVLYREKRIDNNTANTLDPDGDTHFRYKAVQATARVGSLPTHFVQTVIKTGGAAQFVYWPWCIEIETNAAEVEFRLRPSGTSTRYLLRVNGNWATVDPPGDTHTPGSIFGVQLTFPDARWRRIEIILPGQDGFGGAWVSPGATLRRSTYSIRRSVAFIGDSITNGSGVPPSGASNVDTYALRVAQMLGADEVILAGVGGTRWVPPASGTADALDSHFGGGRLDEVLAMSPDVIVFFGSVNESASTAAVETAVEDALDKAAAVPEVYVADPHVTSIYSPGIRAATESRGRKYVSMGATIVGAGYLGSEANDGGNRDWAIGTDAVHPTFAGHKLIAERMFAGISDLRDRAVQPDSLFMPAALFTARQGAPTRSSTLIYGADVWMLDAASTESVIGHFMIPRDWSRYSAFIIGCNASGGGTGNVRLLLESLSLGVGLALGGASPRPFQVEATVAAGAAGIRQDHALVTSGFRPVSGEVGVWVARNGAHTDDTLANDYAFFGVRFVKIA